MGRRGAALSETVVLSRCEWVVRDAAMSVVRACVGVAIWVCSVWHAGRDAITVRAFAVWSGERFSVLSLLVRHIGVMPMGI